MVTEPMGEKYLKDFENCIQDLNLKREKQNHLIYYKIWVNLNNSTGLTKQIGIVW